MVSYNQWVRYCSNCGAENLWLDPPQCRKCGWRPGEPTPKHDSFYTFKSCRRCGGTGRYTKNLKAGPEERECNWCYGNPVEESKGLTSGRARFVFQTQEYGILGNGRWGAIYIREYFRKKERQNQHWRVAELSENWARERLKSLRNFVIKCKWCEKRKKDWGDEHFYDWQGKFVYCRDTEFCSVKCRDAEFRWWRRQQLQRERGLKWVRKQRETLKSIRRILRERASESRIGESIHQRISATS